MNFSKKYAAFGTMRIKGDIMLNMIYEELIGSIDEIDTDLEFCAHVWLADRGIDSCGGADRIGANIDWKQLANEVARIAFEAGKSEKYSKGYDDAAKDPSAWYVLDKNGKEVYIGDTVKNRYGSTLTVTSLGKDKSGHILINNYYYELIEKAIPDSREKIEGDFSEWFGSLTDFSDKTEADIMFKSFMDRCEALEGE